jgi:hypothetical protein
VDKLVYWKTVAPSSATSPATNRTYVLDAGCLKIALMSDDRSRTAENTHASSGNATVRIVDWERNPEIDSLDALRRAFILIFTDHEITQTGKFDGQQLRPQDEEEEARMSPFQGNANHM